MPDAETEARLKRIEAVLARIDARIDALEAARPAPAPATPTPAPAPGPREPIAVRDIEEVRTLRDQVVRITGERDALSASIRQLQAQRVRPTPDQIGQSFAGAADRLRQGLGTRFAVAGMDIEMKSQLAVEADGSLRFVLPQPGEAVAAESLSTLKLTLRAAAAPAADAAPLVEVPALVGLSREAALLLLGRAGLKPGRETRQPAPARAGTVLAQDPPAGDEIAAEIAVDLVLAAPFPVPVPDLAGQTPEEAARTLDQAGLARGKVSDAREALRGARPGTVQQQSPVSGSAAEPGTAVDLLLVPPPPPPPPPATGRVPALAGRAAPDAARALQEAGLAAGPATRLASSRPDGTVLETDPAAGTELPRGTPVALTLARATTVPAIIERVRARAAAPAAPPVPGRTLPSGPGTGRVVPPGTPGAPPPQPLPANRLAEQLAALNLASPEEMVALSEQPDAVLATRLALPTPRDAAQARTLLRAVLRE